MNTNSENFEEKIKIEIKPSDSMHNENTNRNMLKDIGELNSLNERPIRVQLRWENINIIPKSQLKKTEVAPKKILDSVCGTVKPNEFLAIIGASGIAFCNL